MKNRFLIRLLFLTFIFSLLIGIIGCEKAKKPAPLELSPEVKRYQDKEPTISLYQTATHTQQNIKLEEYIKGVVAAEIGDEFPMEALKAQAIVARTMTLALLEYENGTRDKHNTDASDDHTEFQAYNQKLITDRIARAVESTRGQVLVTNKGKFVYAFFHSVSQDKTASIEEAFPKLKNKAPYIVPVDTYGFKYAPDKYKNWTVKVPRAKVKEIMGSTAGSLDDIKISQKGPSGRAMAIAAGKASISGVDLRQAIGFDTLYSTKLSSIRPQGNYIIFKGSGWGHGAGMEQWGAYTMAKDNDKNAREIVEYYFPQARWVQLYK